MNWKHIAGSIIMLVLLVAAIGGLVWAFWSSLGWWIMVLVGAGVLFFLAAKWIND
jgi:hypothetical protein